MLWLIWLVVMLMIAASPGISMLMEHYGSTRVNHSDRLSGNPRE